MHHFTIQGWNNSVSATHADSMCLSYLGESQAQVGLVLQCLRLTSSVGVGTRDLPGKSFRQVRASVVRSVKAQSEQHSQRHVHILSWGMFCNTLLLVLAFTKAEQDSVAKKSSFSIFGFNFQLLRRNRLQIFFRTSWQLFQSLVLGWSTHCDKRRVLWIFPCTHLAIWKLYMPHTEFIYIHARMHK